MCTVKGPGRGGCASGRRAGGNSSEDKGDQRRARIDVSARAGQGNRRRAARPRQDGAWIQRVLYVRLIESCVRDGAFGARARIACAAQGKVPGAGISPESGGASASWTGCVCSRALAGTGVSLAQEGTETGAAGFWIAEAGQESFEACAGAASCMPLRGPAAKAGSAGKTGPECEKFVAHTKERASAIRMSSAGTAGTDPCPARRRMQGPARRADITAGPSIPLPPPRPQDQQGGEGR